MKVYFTINYHVNRRMPEPREPPKHESGQNAVQSVRTNFQKTKKSDLTIF